MLKFWFDRGVKGLRLDATKHYMEDPLFRDEPLKDPTIVKPRYGYRDYNHIYTTDLWELYEFIHEFREYVDAYNAKGGDDERSENVI